MATQALLSRGKERAKEREMRGEEKEEGDDKLLVIYVASGKYHPFFFLFLALYVTLPDVSHQQKSMKSPYLSSPLPPPLSPFPSLRPQGDDAWSSNVEFHTLHGFGEKERGRFSAIVQGSKGGTVGVYDDEGGD